MRSWDEILDRPPQLASIWPPPEVNERDLTKGDWAKPDWGKQIWERVLACPKSERVLACPKSGTNLGLSKVVSSRT